MAKRTKASVSFEHPAKGREHCKRCQHFQPERHRCDLVAGKILPGDWCKKYEPK